MANDEPMIKPSHKGLLHKHLDIPEGQPIPTKRLMEALHSPDPQIREEANFAGNEKHWKKD